MALQHPTNDVISCYFTNRSSPNVTEIYLLRTTYSNIKNSIFIVLRNNRISSISSSSSSSRRRVVRGIFVNHALPFSFSVKCEMVIVVGSGSGGRRGGADGSDSVSDSGNSVGRWFL